MDYLHALILGLVQGLTEFLPVSSSAHLILLPELLDREDQGPIYDITAHAGSLLAVLIYFRHDILRICNAWAGTFGQPLTTDARTGWYLIVATLPLCLAGYLLTLFIGGDLRNPLVIAAATCVFALLLWWSDVKGARTRTLADLALRDALIIGAMQVLALVPGTSRSGITITAGLMLGLDRQSASRFAFLLAIPAILAASGYGLLRILSAAVVVDWILLLIVLLVSFLSAMTAIHFFLKLLDRIAMLPYVVYRLLLGALLFSIFL